MVKARTKRMALPNMMKEDGLVEVIKTACRKKAPGLRVRVW